MNKILQKTIKSSLIIAALLLVALLITGLVLILDWPWWTALPLLLLLLGVVAGAVFLKKILLRKKEQQFVEQIVAQDAMQTNSMTGQDKQASQLLQDQWKASIERLKQSHLKKIGNPLYVLPWYLIIGESGSGKTTAIKSARLSSPFADAAQVSGLSGTRNCDWWFFEQAVIIDTAGRYAVPVNEETDKEEWGKFLTLLAKYRKKEPLNGLIVTLAADKLLGASAEELEREGLLIRARIDELMQGLGAKFPVYLLVTKCDLIKGMTQFFDKLPAKVVDQAMGIVNQQPAKVSPSFWTQAVETIGTRLRNLLLRIVHDTPAKKVDPSLILFPFEFERLSKGLRAFMGKAFQENPYQETPIMRGIFFTSGRQEGTPYSHFLHKLGLLAEKEVLPGTSRGLFLHDFFAKILPADRGIFAPTRKAIEWNRLTRNLGLTSWVAFVLALCGLLSFSFVKNLKTMREVPKQFLQEGPILQGDLLTDVVTLNQYKEAILKVEASNSNWWIPRFGLNESSKVEARLKQRFDRQFRKGFLLPLDKKMIAGMADFTPATGSEVISRHISHLVRRVNLIKTRLKTDDRQRLAALPPPSFLVLLANKNSKLLPEINKKTAGMYLYYLLWNHDRSAMNLEMNNLQNWLKHTLAVNKYDLNWLITWADDQQSLQPVTLKDFWGGNKELPTAVIIQPAFTREGKKLIDKFQGELARALPEPGATLIAAREMSFSTVYRQAFIEDWHKFSANFQQGSSGLSGYNEWFSMAQKVTALQGPYLTFIDKAAAELAPLVVKRGDAPPWVDLILRYPAVRKQAAALAKSTGGSFFSKAETKSKELFKGLGRETDTKNALEHRMQAAQACLDYEKALRKTAPLLSPRKAAYGAAAAVFNGDKSELVLAGQAVTKLQTYMASGRGNGDVFWHLLHGPMDFLWDFIRTETSCYLQDRWEKDVLVNVQDIHDPQRLRQLLMAKNGYAIQFLKGPAAPFISIRPGRGYYAVRALGRAIPLQPGFLSFLTRGISSTLSARASYDVSIKGLPTDVNTGAVTKPYATDLELQCAGGTTKLSNFQFPIMKKFHWSPATCGDVLFDIKVGNLTLSKQYRGSEGFPEFLNDFKTGQHLFYPRDFPQNRDALQRMGIRYIKVNYRFSGNRPVLKLLQGSSGKVPSRIGQCWE
ncbi:MAG TPA: type VI secretion system protein ImpL [Desulfobacterales bacterium]|nr:type VI secretion system protein ImpL [Desulfobacterales bacterium]